MPSAVAPSQRPTRDELRQRIMCVADKLCRLRGYDKTTVADIAGELGISPAYVYKFFPSKQAILEACAEQRLADKKERLLAAAKVKKKALERLEAVLNALYQVHRERFNKEGNIYRLIVTAHEQKWACIRHFRDFILKLTTDIVEEGMRKKEFAAADPLDTARVLLDSFTWITHPLLYNELDASGVEARIRAQLALLGKGLR